MNRIAFAAEKLLSPPAHSSVNDANSVTWLVHGVRQRPAIAVTPPHTTFAPLHYEPGYAYPLVVWLHGRAGNEQQLRRVMPHLSLQNFVAVAPRGTSSLSTRRPEFNWQQTEDEIAEAETRVLLSIVAAQERFNIHAERVFLAGVNAGGTMAVRIGWNHPEWFAGVATLGGPLPTRYCPLRRVNELRRLPCLVCACRASRKYPEDHVCRDLRLMHSAGCVVALRQYPGDDELTTGMLSDLNGWMMELVCGGGAEVSKRAVER